MALKENILRYQTADDFAVLSYDDEVTRSLAAKARASVLFFSRSGDIPGDGGAPAR